MAESNLAGSLDFLPRGSEEFARRCVALARAAKRSLILHPWTDAMRELAARLAREAPTLRLCVHESEASASGALPAAPWSEVDAVVFDSAPETLQAHLLNLLDLPRLQVLAPLSDGFFRNRPLFIVTIPKSGSNILYRFVEFLGYSRGIVYDEFPLPGHWYFLEYFNSHTLARDFFVDSARRAPWSNSHHAFASSPVLFNFRHPLDVLVSEANYYHREGKSIFAGYFAGLTLEQRVHRLIDDRWMLGTIRDRICGFAPWLEFPNVIPISFEELIGREGGGSDEDQLRLIWSLQLKLQVPGEPHAFAMRVFDRGSPTFFQGKIGAWRSVLSPDHLARIARLDQDFMSVFGYSRDGATGHLPARAAEFRRRPLRVAPPLLDKEAIALEYNYLGFNLLRHAGWIYAVPQPLGPGFDLGKQPERRLRMLPRERSLQALRHRLSLRSILWAGKPDLMAHDIYARLSGIPTWRRWLRALLGVTGLLNLAARARRGLPGEKR
jgi:hypothetical protein